MIKICKQNQDDILKKIYSNEFDRVEISQSNFADDIILSMYNNGIIDCLANSIIDKRAKNTTIPFNLIMILSIAAKMKSKTSLSDIPYAITDHRTLSKLGYNIANTENGIMRESSLRFLLGKYDSEEILKSYNNTVQKYIMKNSGICPDIHILDCTEISVNIDNKNYEESSVTKNKYGDADRGYKLATLRGLVNDTGIIEEIRFGAMNIHDFKLSKEMLRTTAVLKPGDILIEDRGFLDRDLINYLKIKRGVDTFIPLKTNMTAYQIAVTAAQLDNVWEEHPSRKNHKIAFVSDLGQYWTGKNGDDVAINAVVSWDTDSDNFFVFVTTDTNVDARQIIMTYELRPEIEEDYRQLKDFWNLEDFKSTKLNMITFHIIITLFGYLFFQLYILTSDGEKYTHKSLPIILKNYQSKQMPYLIFYANSEFGIFSIIEFAKIYYHCCDNSQERLGYLLC
ncbi:MAG: transposase [Bacilli bacterium]|nr:transposase [Bacilli bacterium]